jgi:hypothetical protein
MNVFACTSSAVAMCDCSINERIPQCAGSDACIQFAAERQNPHVDVHPGCRDTGGDEDMVKTQSHIHIDTRADRCGMDPLPCRSHVGLAPIANAT